MTLEVITLIKKIAELTKDDPLQAVFTNGRDYWIVLNNNPCMVTPCNDSLYIPGLTKEDLIF